MMKNADCHEMSESGETPARGERAWYVRDGFLFGIFVALCVVLFAVPSTIRYVAARRDGQFSAIALVVSMWLALLVFIWLWVLAIRMFFTWPRRAQSFKRLVLAWAAAGIGTVSCPVLCFMLSPCHHKVFTWGFREYARAHADIQAIQDWLKTVDPDAAMGMSQWTRWRELRSDWPETIVRLDPEHLALTLDTEGRPKVSIGWSAIDLAWGLTVGHEAMPIPQTQPRVKERLPAGHVTYNPGRYYLPLAPGAYVWHNIE